MVQAITFEMLREEKTRPINDFQFTDLLKKKENTQAECIINSILSNSIQAKEISYF